MKKILFNLKLSLTLVFSIPIFFQIMSVEKCFVSFSQTSDQCEEQLDKAQQEYILGNFQKAIDLIEPCLKKSNVSEEEKGKGYRLLGLVYIGQQLQKEANEAVKNLLLMVPNYKINPETDPPQLKRIIDEMAPTLIPQISSITPNSVEKGRDGFTLTVKGSNFVYGTEVKFNGNTKSTTFINSVELKAEISAEDVREDGEYNVNVFSPILGGKKSNTLTLNVSSKSSFPWTWIAVGGGAVVAGTIAIITLGGKSDKGSNDNGTTQLADPPARP